MLITAEVVAQRKLHYYCDGLPIGTETFRYSRADRMATLQSDLQLTHFTKVDLKATDTIWLDGKQSSWHLKGQSHPWMPFDSADTKNPQILFPLGRLEALLRSNKNADGKVNITLLGEDILRKGKSTKRLKKFAVTGNTWGSSVVWTNAQHEIMAFAGSTVAYTVQAFDNEMLPYREFFKRGYATTVLSKLMSGIESENGNKPVCFEHINIWDGSSDSLQTNMFCLVAGGKVKTISKMPIAVGAGTLIVNGRGKTMMPPLTDMHAHLKQPEWLPAYLATGVLTVRDLGNDSVYLNALEKKAKQLKISPTIFKAGFIDGVSERPRTAVMAGTAAEGRAMVRLFKAQGYDEIKVWNNIKPEVLKAIADETHKLGLSLTGHVPSGMDWTSALDSGLNQINHLFFISSAVNADDAAAVAQAIKILKDKKVSIDPTLVVIEVGWHDKAKGLAAYEPGVMKVPKFVTDAWTIFGATGDDVETGKKHLSNAMKLLKKFYDAGIPILAGSDQGIPGYSFLRELELYVTAGLTPVEALKTATEIPARHFAIKNYGLKPGSDQFIVIDGNPLKTISDLRKVQMIFLHGGLFSTQQFSSKVDFALDATRISTTLLNGPDGMTIDKDGNIVIANWGRDGKGKTVVRITTDGKESVFLDSLASPDGLTFDAAGNLYVSNFGAGEIVRIDKSGNKTVYASGLDHPADLKFDNKGNLYVSSFGNFNGTKVYKISQDKKVSVFADGLKTPLGLAFDKQQRLYVSTFAAGNIHRIDSEGKIDLFSSLLDDKAHMLQYLAFDRFNNLYCPSYKDNCIYKFSADGKRQLFLVTANGKPLDGPNSIFISGDYLYFTEFNTNSVYRVRLEK